MLYSSGNIGAARPCPYLGLVDDASTACLFITDDQRCYRSTPAPAGARRQATYCISGSYSDCPRFSATDLEVAAWTRSRPFGRVGSLPLGRTSVLVITIVTCALAIAAFVISATVSRETDEAAGQNATMPTAVDTPTAPQNPVLPLTPAVAGAGPIAPPTPPAQSITTAGSARAVPTAVSATSAGQRSYLVVAGDTLWSIAQKHGISVEALMKANGLTDRGYVRSGQRLVIPER